MVHRVSKDEQGGDMPRMRMFKLGLLLAFLVSIGSVAYAAPARSRAAEENHVRALCDDNAPLCAEVMDSIGYEGRYTGHGESSLLFDSPAGLVTAIHDLTTGQSESMTASVTNGFAQINYDPTATTCTQTPYAFHPMYSTSSEHTRVPWAAHSYNAAFSDEI